MKSIGTVGAGMLIVLLVAMPARAQQPTANDPHHPSAAPAAPAPAPSSGMAGDKPAMDMCHQIMADSMTMPLMGGAMTPKERAAMLQMRGEMMKAMGDIMMNHARRMQGPTNP